MKRKALYHDGKFVRFLEPKLKPIKPTTIEVLDVDEEAEPTIISTEKKEFRWEMVNGKHRKVWTKRNKTQEELNADSLRINKEKQRANMLSLISSFNSGTATPVQVQKAIAYCLGNLEGGF